VEAVVRADRELELIDHKVEGRVVAGLWLFVLDRDILFIFFLEVDEGGHLLSEYLRGERD
jgi:hypothetical protein